MSQQRDTSNDIAMTREDLKEWMQTHDMTVSELAEMLGLTNQAVIYWTQGKRTIPEPIGRLLVFLGQRPHLFREF